jgi:tetratricopeptide (TPR) repeat protein
MRVNLRWLALFLLAAGLPLTTGCSFYSKLMARDNLNKGVKAYTEQKYDIAAEFFEKSIAQDPDFQVARMYLATTYSTQFVPGSPDPRSAEMADKAIATFKDVVSRPDAAGPNVNAMLSIASLYYQLHKYDESKDWCRKIQSVDANNAESLYRIAVIDYDDSLAKTGLQGENVEFLNAEEKAHTLQDIDEGLKSIDQALKIKPDYFDAMEYQNLLWREKAKFEKDEKAKQALIQEADKVAQRALVMRLKAQEEEAKKPKKLGISKGK